jgi:hypothetical protein
MPQERTLVSFDWAIKYLLKNKADYVILEGFLTTLLGKKIKIKKQLPGAPTRTPFFWGRPKKSFYYNFFSPPPPPPPI